MGVVEKRETPQSRASRDPGESVRRTDRPTGRTEVVSAILAAAEVLFTERSPAAVSLREVAERAGVNFGLVYKYVGSKEQLVVAVLRQAASRTADRLAETDDLAAALDLVSTFGDGTIARMTAWSLLEGNDALALIPESPALDVLASLAQRDAQRAGWAVSEEEAQLLAALAMVVTIGSRMFAPTALAAAGLGAGAKTRYDGALVRYLRLLADCAHEIVGVE